MRIAARALLCGNAFRVHADISGGLFEELRQLCAAAAEKRWLAIGMVGLLGEHMMHGKVREASQLASEHMTLIESIGETGEMGEALRWSQTVIELADGDPTKGNFVFGVAVGVGAGHARHRSMGAGPCGVARRLRPGARHGPQH
jgi:adenylate cyclase